MADALLSQRISRAAKQHVCDQCGQPIHVGERHKAEAMVWEGEFQVYRSHLDCDRAAASYHRMARLNWDEGVNLRDEVGSEPDEMAAWLAECHPSVALRMGLVVTPYL